MKFASTLGRPKFLDCLLLFCTPAAFLFSQDAAAFDLGVGLSAAGSNDDRHRPAINLMAGNGGEFEARAFYYGRRFNIVREHTFLLSGNYVVPMPMGFLKSLKVSVGPALYWNYTEFVASDKSSRRTDNAVSIGANMGLQLELLAIGPTSLKARWEAHLFPAGLAFLFLATDRVQMISLTEEVHL